MPSSTHLHLDYTDGLKFFPGAEVLVSAAEWEKPFGATTTTFPPALAPTLLTYQRRDDPFRFGYKLTDYVEVVVTPGHTYGHQSVLVSDHAVDFLLAGDVSFSEEQLRGGQKAGIIVDWDAASRTYAAILSYAEQRPLVYLPSHDPATGSRLECQVVLDVNFGE
jgi:glyoxylase-like metal-dependent hydrolase (beta-lactamase superfamily II)